jgi:SAM-dependent methyltransferase
VQSIEHVPDPDRVLAEVVRVLEPGGTAVLVTPNRLEFARPDEIIDSYHHVEFDPDELRRAVRAVLRRGDMLGLFGSARWRELVDEEDRRLHHLLRLDPLRLRRLVPRRGSELVYAWLLMRYRRRRPDPRVGGSCRRTSSFAPSASSALSTSSSSAVSRGSRRAPSYASVGDVCVGVAFTVSFAVPR